MTQEEKELLIKDLCGRIPYGVKIELTNSWGYHHENVAKKGDVTIDRLKGFTGSYFTIYHDNPLDWDWYESDIDIEDIKPYLFPLSSMTEEQKDEFDRLYTYDELIVEPQWELIDFCNKHHLDYRGLIPLGLANDSTGLNIY